jgi:hypothetical protein
MKRKKKFPPGPYLLAAVLCEKVLAEPDNTKSAIRMVELIKPKVLRGKLPKKMKPFQKQLDLLLRLKNGTALGNHTIEVVPTSPSGKEGPRLIHTHNFQGPEEDGIDIVAHLILNFKREGRYWFNVYLDGKVMTRVPLKVLYSSEL